MPTHKVLNMGMETNTNPTTAIAIAETVNRWAIAIVKGSNFRTGADLFRVVRVAPDNKYVTLTAHDDEAGARKSANSYWKLDTGRAGYGMIHA